MIATGDLGMKLRIGSEHVTSETVDGEVVILDQVSGSYYSLTGAGAEIWALLASPRSAAELVAAASARFDAEPATVRAEVERLLAELEREALLVRAEGAGDAPGPTTSEGPRVAWSAPKLEKFTDLQQLLLLDPIHDVDESGWPRPAKGEV
jgi:hypothetical protein